MARLKTPLAALVVALIAGPAGAQQGPARLRREAVSMLRHVARDGLVPRTLLTVTPAEVQCRYIGHPVAEGRVYPTRYWRCIARGVVLMCAYPENLCGWSRDNNPPRSR